jgi:hypothetical protein
MVATVGDKTHHTKYPKYDCDPINKGLHLDVRSGEHSLLTERWSISALKTNNCTGSLASRFDNL